VSIQQGREHPADRPHWPRVMLVTDGLPEAIRRVGAIARRVLDGGVPLAIQIREKQMSARELLIGGRGVLRQLDAHRGHAPVVINGRLDIALAVGAQGVHLPALGLPVSRVRAAIGQGLVVGASTHSPEEVRRAGGQGADYVVFGAVFATPSKVGMGEPHGLRGLEAAVAAAGSMPLLAIGGITSDRAERCRGVGAWGVAVIRALHDASDVVVASQALAGLGAESPTSVREKA
jgi:thiamine-phosphate pyrophosphorylase